MDNILHKLNLSYITPQYLDELGKKCYEDDRSYPENFSNWYPCIKDFGQFKHADIISNQIFTYEEIKVMQQEERKDNVDWEKWLKILWPTLQKMKRNTIYSIKNGCYSNKFDFETSIVRNKLELAQKLFDINYNSSLLDTGGYTELVIRDYIPYDSRSTLLMYNGMPLRTEVRVFYNMDTHKIEYMVDYWDYDYCYTNIHSLTDKIVFSAFHNKLNGLQSDINIINHKEDYNRACNYIQKYIDTLKIEGLSGIWSIDFMCKGYDVYLVDMARGFRSAYWDINKLSKETQLKIKEEEKNE